MVDDNKNNKKSNITLIGMPACGKSTVGVVLAKRMGLKFIDGDILIQEQTGKLLKDLISEYGDDGFRQIEEDVIYKLNTDRSVISPGGSVIYGEKAMKHLKDISTVIYLNLPYRAIKTRLGNLSERGVSIKEGQTLKDLYDERTKLYKQYADITIDEYKKSVSKVATEIASMMIAN